MARSNSTRDFWYAVRAATSRLSAVARACRACNVSRVEPAPSCNSLPVMSKVCAAMIACPGRCSDASGGLLQRVLGIADLNADLLALLLQQDLCLPRLQLGAVLIALGLAVADGDREVETDKVVGRTVVEGVLNRPAEADGRRGDDACARAGDARQGPGRRSLPPGSPWAAGCC